MPKKRKLNDGSAQLIKTPTTSKRKPTKHKKPKRPKKSNKKKTTQKKKKNTTQKQKKKTVKKRKQSKKALKKQTPKKETKITKIDNNLITQTSKLVQCTEKESIDPMWGAGTDDSIEINASFLIGPNKAKVNYYSKSSYNEISKYNYTFIIELDRSENSGTAVKLFDGKFDKIETIDFEAIKDAVLVFQIITGINYSKSDQQFIYDLVKFMTKSIEDSKHKKQKLGVELQRFAIYPKDVKQMCNCTIND